MGSLFNLAKEYDDLYHTLIATADEETGEVDVDIAAALANVQGTFEEKAIATATVSRKIKYDLEDISKEIERLKRLKEHLERENNRLMDYIKQAMEMTGTVKIQGIAASISFRKTEKVVSDYEGSEELIPDEYMRTKIIKEMDKVKIASAIKAGKEVPGAHIETVMNLQIK